MIASQVPASQLSQKANLSLNQLGWNAEVQAALEQVLNNPENAGRAAVLNFDNTCMAFDIGEATFEELGLTMSKLPRKARSLMESLAKSNSPVDLMSLFRPWNTGGVTTEALNKYCLLVQVMEGLTPAAISSAASAVFHHKSKLSFFPKPHPYPEMVELIGKLQAANIDVWMLSSSNPWSVRATVDGIINPLLKEAGHPLMPLHRVVGLGTKLLDIDGQLKSDRELVQTDAGYCALDEGRLSQLTLTTELDTQVCAFDGKATICKSLFNEAPVLAIGAGASDLAMLSLAETSILIAKPYEAQQLLDLNVQSPNKRPNMQNFLVQPIGLRDWIASMQFNPH